MGNLNGKYHVKTLGIEDYQAMTACQSACPLGTDTKRYVRAISDGDYEKAFLIARQTNPLVSVCSRVCTAPCEKSCRKSDEGSPVDIRALKRFACDRHGVASPRAVAQRLDEYAQREGRVSDRIGSHILTITNLLKKAKGADPAKEARVAVVGSGPAGLAAAHDLALLGYRVTIFEAGPVAGGQLTTGIPGFRLPKEIVQKEIQAILELGVELKLNAPIGKGRTLADLKSEGYRAVFLTIGLQDPLLLNLAGSELKGVYNGIDYVREHRQSPVGKHCLVIGGGGVAIDCAQHALRQGAARVTLACLESWETMPASLSDKEDAQEEGIEFLPSMGPQRIVGAGGQVTGVEFLRVASVFDAEGRFNPSFVPNSLQRVEADTVILAVGQSSTAPKLTGLDGLDLTPNGLIKAGDDMSTNLPGVFAGGDVRFRFARNATDAIADGQKAARAIHVHLSGVKLEVTRRAYMKPAGPQYQNTRCDTIAAQKSPKRAPQERVRTQEEITLGYREEQAREQASRCRQCNVQTVFDRSRCLLCATCVDSCPRGSIKMVRLGEIEGDEQVQRLTRSLDQAAGRKGRTAIIKDESRCVSCGTCARRCPGGAIAMAEFYFEEEWE